ncbi:MAG TPA: helix-turn-helix transcriptional regulator [Bacteroidales bacterium]|nr:helix-turn-helix transcriptional regulator [Bacteroidales bacterium]
MKDRIQQFLNQTGYTATKLADELKIQRSGISHILSGRNQPSYDFMVRLLNRFPDVSADWLLTGKGNMYKNKTENKDIDLFQPSLTSIKTEEKKQEPKLATESSIVTNVNIQKVIVLKSDGTFEIYKSSDND